MCMSLSLQAPVAVSVLWDKAVIFGMSLHRDKHQRILQKSSKAVSGVLCHPVLSMLISPQTQVEPSTQYRIKLGFSRVL